MKNETIEQLKVQITVGESAISSLKDELDSNNNDLESAGMRLRDEQHRHSNCDNELKAMQTALEQSKVEIATLKERGRTFDAQLDNEHHIHASALEREGTLRAEMEKNIHRISQENSVLRKRHDMLAVERDRAHEGYLSLRKQTERLQNAARTAARKAQLAALSVQHQMMSGRVNERGGGGGGGGDGGGGDKTTSKMGEEAFNAAEDLSWIALGGNDGRGVGRKGGGGGGGGGGDTLEQKKMG